MFQDGMSVMFGGFMGVGTPLGIVAALLIAVDTSGMAAKRPLAGPAGCAGYGAENSLKHKNPAHRLYVPRAGL